MRKSKHSKVVIGPIESAIEYVDMESPAMKWWTIDETLPIQNQVCITEAAIMLMAGQTIAFPTETVYGLGANACNHAAVERIFVAKGRPPDNPLIVHIADLEQLNELVLSYGQIAQQLMNRFWPGPLTMVLPVQPHAVSSRVTAGLDTVAVRMPAHDTALALIRAAGCPIAAPSANRSGRPSPTRAEHVYTDLIGRIGGIIDGGPTGVGVESTVIEMQGDRVHVLRPGGVTMTMLSQVVGEVTIDPAVLTDQFVPRSPGMKYTHYAPQGHFCIVQGPSPGCIMSFIQADLDAAKRRGETTGILAFAEHVAHYRADIVISLGSMAALEEAARRLYDALRYFDEAGATYMLAEACPTEGIGLAVMNRLTKAAGYRIHYCP